MTNGSVYTLFGPRVPAIFVAGSIAQNTILRPPASSAYPFDHTSVIATLRAQFGLAGPLTARDQNAPVLSGLVSTTSPTQGPDVDLRGHVRNAAKPKPGPRKPLAEHQRRVAQWVRAKERKPRTKD